MFGDFQSNEIRVEMPASGRDIRKSLLDGQQLRDWLLLQNLSLGERDWLAKGSKFTSKIGLLSIDFTVDIVSDDRLRLLLHGGINGSHDWFWGDGWVQSRLEGISLVPLGLCQTLLLLQLRKNLSKNSTSSAA
jgi:hypothetical protein